MVIDIDQEASQLQFRLEAENIRAKLNQRMEELDHIENLIGNLEADEATYRDVFDPMRKYCMLQHAEPLPKKRHSSLMGRRVTRDSVFMPQYDVSSKLGIERPVTSDEDQFDDAPEEIPLIISKRHTKTKKSLKIDS